MRSTNQVTSPTRQRVSAFDAVRRASASEGIDGRHRNALAGASGSYAESYPQMQLNALASALGSYAPAAAILSDARIHRAFVSPPLRIRASYSFQKSAFPSPARRHRSRDGSAVRGRHRCRGAGHEGPSRCPRKACRRERTNDRAVRCDEPGRVEREQLVLGELPEAQTNGVIR